MPLSTADISIQLLMDTTNTLQEIESRMKARAFGAVHIPEQVPEVHKNLLNFLPCWTGVGMGCSELEVGSAREQRPSPEHVNRSLLTSPV